MKFLFFSLLLLPFFIFSSAHAHSPKKGLIHASLGPAVNQTVNPPDSGHSEAHFGGGLVVEADFNDNYGLELGLFYLERQYHYSQVGEVLVEKVNRVHLPLGLRYWPKPFWSLGGFFYSAYRTGNVNEIARSSSTAVLERTSAERDIAEYGFEISIQGEFLQRNKYSLITDLRYSYPITNSRGETAEQVYLFSGIKWMVD